jgi:uncharacterized membrane protein YphA (DoxX/SURF4 family)
MLYGLWAAQILLALLFLYAGVTKTLLSRERLVAMGTTAAAVISEPLLRFIGICELLGAIGLIAPRLFHLDAFLTPAAAALLGVVMLLASAFHLRRHETKVAAFNWLFLALCLAVAYGTTRIPA